MQAIGSPHVLMVDDDAAVCSQVRDYLELNDLRVTTAHNGTDMFEILERGMIDLLMLALTLAGEDGIDLARSVRANSTMPIVFTGHIDEVDRFNSQEHWVDAAYVTKPFARRELLARIREMLRRSRLEVVASGQTPNETLRGYRFAGWELNVRSRRLRTPRGESVAIPRTQFRLLCAFLSAPQRVLTRNQLIHMSRLHSGSDISERAMKLQIMRLRRRLEPDPTQPTFIRTEWGAGYYFDSPVQLLHG